MQSVGWKMAVLDNTGCVPVCAKALSPVTSRCAQAVVGGDGS